MIDFVNSYRKFMKLKYKKPKVKSPKIEVPEVIEEVIVIEEEPVDDIRSMIDKHVYDEVYGSVENLKKKSSKKTKKTKKSD